jgi:thiamine phosphate synthase YjbQ (UPF0047 family)
MRAVYHKGGADLCIGDAHCCECVHQRRRRPLGRLHNRTGEDNADAQLKQQVMGREVVVAVTNGRLDFGTWERIFQGQAEWLARES